MADWIRVGRTDLQTGYRSHRRTADAVRESAPLSANLLVFYAAECGVKHLYLRHRNLPVLDADNSPPHGHDIKKWLEEMRVGAAEVRPPPHFRLAGRPNTEQYTADKAHQSWRYGARMVSDDEKALVQWLEGVCALVEERFQG